MKMVLGGGGERNYGPDLRMRSPEGGGEGGWEMTQKRERVSVGILR